MKSEQKNLSPTELALLTWYKSDSPLYKDPEHPVIKLAGEIGELLDLYGKHEYKPGFNWMYCRYCGYGDASHSTDKYCCPETTTKYTPLVFDELGDVWYYLRILAWQANVILSLPDDWQHYSNVDCTKIMYEYASSILFMPIEDMELALQEIYFYFNILLANLNFTLPELTLLNYHKLNSDETHHGWKAK